MREKEDLQRVNREITYLKMLNHINIIKIFEIIENSNCFYIIMEYAKGGELFNHIVKKTKLSCLEASFFYYQLINGLEYIHRNKIVHRDLKPENLLLNENYILKIIDFGLSNHYTNNNTLKTPCGSPCYAAPEMIQGKSYYGINVDIWSTGIILFAMVCGHLPFEDSNNELLYKKILECKYEVTTKIDENCYDIMKRILSVNPSSRITLDEIKKHSFYLQGEAEFMKSQSFHTDEDVSKIEEQVILQMVENGFSKDEIIHSLESKNFNESFTHFSILLSKFLRENAKTNKKQNQVNTLLEFDQYQLLSRIDNPSHRQELENKFKSEDFKKSIIKEIKNDRLSFNKERDNKTIQNDQNYSTKIKMKGVYKKNESLNIKNIWLREKNFQELITNFQKSLQTEHSKEKVNFETSLKQKKNYLKDLKNVGSRDDSKNSKEIRQNYSHNNSYQKSKVLNSFNNSVEKIYDEYKNRETERLKTESPNLLFSKKLKSDNDKDHEIQKSNSKKINLIDELKELYNSKKRSKISELKDFDLRISLNNTINERKIQTLDSAKKIKVSYLETSNKKSHRESPYISLLTKDEHLKTDCSSELKKRNLSFLKQTDNEQNEKKIKINFKKSEEEKKAFVKVKDSTKLKKILNIESSRATRQNEISTINYHDVRKKSLLKEISDLTNSFTQANSASINTDVFSSNQKNLNKNLINNLKVKIEDRTGNLIEKIKKKKSIFEEAPYSVTKMVSDKIDLGDSARAKQKIISIIGKLGFLIKEVSGSKIEISKSSFLIGLDFLKFGKEIRIYHIQGNTLITKEEIKNISNKIFSS